MLLELSQILDTPGATLAYSHSMDLSDLRYGAVYPVSEPVLAEGSVRNTAGVLIMTGRITTCIHGTCDRCASSFSRDVEIPVDVVLTEELSNEEDEDEWVFPLAGGKADLDEIVRTVFVLNFNSKMLCKPDCKGLCCQCGKNLNEGPCNCKKEIDPRLAVLQQLLKK